MGTPNENPQWYNVTFVFWLCQGVRTLEAFKQLVHLLDRHGFHPTPAVGGEVPYPAFDVNAVVEMRFRDLEAEGIPFGGLLRSTGFGLYMDDFPPDGASASFHWRVFKGQYVEVSLTGGIWATVEEQVRYHEPFATKVLEIALQLYPLARPKYGAIVDLDVDSYPISVAPIVRTKITTLSWVTFFGPEYVAKFGRELLAGIPGWRVEDLPDGGLLHQARPNIVVDEATHERWQQEAAAYLAAHGIPIRFYNLMD